MIPYLATEEGPERVMDLPPGALGQFADALDDALNNQLNGIAVARRTILSSPTHSGLAALDLVTTAAREFLVLIHTPSTR